MGLIYLALHAHSASAFYGLVSFTGSIAQVVSTISVSGREGKELTYSGLSATGTVSYRFGKELPTEKLLTVYGEISELKSTYREPSVIGGSSGQEEIISTGGGAAAQLNRKLFAKLPIKLLTLIGIDGHSAHIRQSGDSPREQLYPLILGGRIGLGLSFRTTDAFSVLRYFELFNQYELRYRRYVNYADVRNPDIKYNDLNEVSQAIILGLRYKL